MHTHRADGGASLVFYALIPESPVQDQITAFKEEAALRFGTKKALNSPAHLTLIPPRWMGAEALDSFDEQVRQISNVIPKGSLTCHGFAAFPPRVIYVGLLESEWLQTLHTHLWEKLRRTGSVDGMEGTHFHPHMTVAFRDLSPEQFALAWPFYQNKSYHAQWQAEGIWRLLHRGEQWEQQVFFPFSSALSTQEEGSL